MSPRMVVTDEPRTTSFHSNKYARQVLGRKKIQHGPGRGCGGSSWGRAGPEPTGPWRGLDGPWRPWSGASRFVSGAGRGRGGPYTPRGGPGAGRAPPWGPGEPGRGRGGPFRALPGHPARKALRTGPARSGGARAAEPAGVLAERASRRSPESSRVLRVPHQVERARGARTPRREDWGPPPGPGRPPQGGGSRGYLPPLDFLAPWNLGVR